MNQIPEKARLIYSGEKIFSEHLDSVVDGGRVAAGEWL